MLIQEAELEQWLREADRQSIDCRSNRAQRQSSHSSNSYVLEPNRNGRRPRLKLVSLDQRFEAAEAYAS